jgi:uncharacterized protein
LIDVTQTDGAVMIKVRVVPRSSKSEIVGEYDGALKVRIAAPPVDGAANAELIALLSKKCGVSKNDVEIVGGQASKTKRVKIANISGARLEELIK